MVFFGARRQRLGLHKLPVQFYSHLIIIPVSVSRDNSILIQCAYHLHWLTITRVTTAIVRQPTTTTTTTTMRLQKCVCGKKIVIVSCALREARGRFEIIARRATKACVHDPTRYVLRVSASHYCRYVIQSQIAPCNNVWHARYKALQPHKRNAVWSYCCTVCTRHSDKSIRGFLSVCRPKYTSICKSTIVAFLTPG